MSKSLKILYTEQEITKNRQGMCKNILVQLAIVESQEASALLNGGNQGGR